MIFHRVFGRPLTAVPAGCEVAYLAAGCFWGVEKLFWNTEGVTNTAAGYQGGELANPTYEQVCTGRTGHAETVRVVFDPAVVSYAELVDLFFENHDPTQGYRQGNDIGPQYRSVIFPVDDAQEAVARERMAAYAQAFAAAGYPPLTTELVRGAEFFYAEEFHQQYLDRVPHGYCPIHATGISCR